MVVGGPRALLIRRALVPLEVHVVVGQVTPAAHSALEVTPRTFWFQFCRRDERDPDVSYCDAGGVIT